MTELKEMIEVMVAALDGAAIEVKRKDIDYIKSLIYFNDGD